MKQIQIIGLGGGDFDQLPLGVYRKLKETERLFLRTKEHPLIPHLEEEGVKYRSFDDIYERHDQFKAVYEEITDRLFAEAQEESLVYAVPGHPLVAEQTVQMLLDRSEQEGVKVIIAGGQSFLDSLFTAVEIDPVDGFQLLDGTQLHRDDLNLHQQIIIAQVYDSFIASEVKLTLMEKYPDDYEVTIITRAGSKNEQVRKVPLYELDRQVELDNLTSVYVPPVQTMELAYKQFSTLRKIISELRGPNGCPWDQQQTHTSLKKYLIEETYELLDAIERDHIDDMIEELGDVLLQVVLHAQIGEDDGLFSIEDVIETVTAKMVRRHPHVFGDTIANNVAEVNANWEEIKEKEKGESETRSLLDQTEKGFPALMRAYDYQKKAAKVGFDWDCAADALMKVKEELKEFEHELAEENKKEQLNELGDLLFAVINMGRLAGIHPEEALQTTNGKFYRRFSYVEKKVTESGQPFAKHDLQSLDRFWNEAKKEGK